MPDCLFQLGVPSSRWTSAAAGTVGEGRSHTKRPVIWRTACRRSPNLQRSRPGGVPGVHEALGPTCDARENSGCTQLCPSIERGGSNGWAIPRWPSSPAHRAGRRPSRRVSSVEGLHRPGVKRHSSSSIPSASTISFMTHEEGVSFHLHYGDVTDATNLIRIIQETQPDEIYNLAAQSHVQVSFETPEYTANGDGLGTLRLLEAIRILGRERDTRFYQASTS